MLDLLIELLLDLRELLDAERIQIDYVENINQHVLWERKRLPLL